VSVLGLVSALIPSLFLIAYFRSRDLYPEPARVIWTTFFLGVATVIPVLAVVLPLGRIIGHPPNPFVRGFIEALFEAAIPEEFFKFLVLVYYAARQPEFDEPMDGIVYGAVASLGFATLENVMYVSGGGTGVAIARALTAVPGHAFLGAIMGYYVGVARRHPEERRALLFRGYLYAVILHAAYDFPLLTLKTAQKAGGIDSATAGLLMVLTTAVLAVEARWALALAGELRREQQKVQALEQGVLAPGQSAAFFLSPTQVAVLRTSAAAAGLSPDSTTAKRAPRRRPWLGGLAVVAGCALGLFGGLVLLGASQELGGHGSLAQQPRALVFTVAAIFGLGPVGAGIALFRWGLRRLGSAPATVPRPSSG
jgi:RsiW-degrading membrane proteinase PrsW (M82 family)